MSRLLDVPISALLQIESLARMWMRERETLTVNGAWSMMGRGGGGDQSWNEIGPAKQSPSRRSDCAVTVEGEAGKGGEKGKLN